jgi:Xaa-Pro aminopeptidase
MATDLVAVRERRSRQVRERLVGAGVDVMLLSLGGVGYCSVITRTVVTGEPPAGLRARPKRVLGSR